MRNEVETTVEERTFRAPDSRTALQAVKAAFGADAVIVSCREVKGGVFKNREVEVVARREVETPIDHSAKDEDEGIQVALRRAAAKRAHRALDSARQRQRDDAPVRATTTPPHTVRTPSRDPFELDERSASARTRLLANLVERGLDEQLASGVAERAHLDGGDDFDRAMQRAERVLKELVTTSRAPWTPDPTGERNIIALVGPTGVGKTTTAAKIAARASVEFGLKVALITTDTYRVGAAQQLVRYAELIEVPVYIVKDVTSLNRALDETEDADLVVIDTAGRSPKDHRTLAHQMSLLRGIPSLTVAWVVPASTSAAALTSFRDRSMELAPDRVIVTKVDEAPAPGAVFNVVGRIDAPLSCTTDGQRIFEDIQSPTASQLVRTVMTGR